MFNMQNVSALKAQERQDRKLQRPIVAAVGEVVRLEIIGRNHWLYNPPYAEDIVCVRSGVTTEKFQ
jgi:hypothetical protein